MAGLFVVAKDDGSRTGKIIMTSPDGSAPWTEQTTPLTDGGNAVAFGGGVYVVGVVFPSTGTNRIASSTDAINWTARSTPADSKNVRDLIYGGGKFVAIYSSTTTPIMTSVNGVAWTAHSVPTPTPGGAGWERVAYSTSLNLYIAISSNGTLVMTSPDAETWTDTGVPVTFSAPACVVWGAGLFVVLGGPEGSGIHLHTSPDGVIWTNQPDPAGNPHRYEGLCFGGGKFVAVSPNGFAASSSTGLIWTQATGVPSDIWQAVCFGDGKYASCANGSSDTQSIMTSTSSTSWTPQTTPAVDNCEAICSSFTPPPPVTMGNVWSGWSQGQGNRW